MTKRADVSVRRCSQERPVRLLLFLLPLVCLLTARTSLRAATVQTPDTVRTVHLRRLAFDEVLGFSTADSAALATSIRQVLHREGLLAAGGDTLSPALDFHLYAPRSISGQALPILLVAAEVGRDFLEAGKVQRILWSYSLPSREYPTWALLREAAASDVSEVVRQLAQRRRRQG